MTGTDSPSDGDAELLAGRCSSGHLTYPPHERCPECGREQTERVDLGDRRGEVVTWTESTATPPGVREPNTLAVVAFEVDGETVRALGGTTGPVSIGDAVEAVYVEQLRDPQAGIREPASQSWSGYRFRPVD